jgi:substrate-binding family protein
VTASRRACGIALALFVAVVSACSGARLPAKPHALGVAKGTHTPGSAHAGRSGAGHGGHGRSGHGGSPVAGTGGSGSGPGSSGAPSTSGRSGGGSGGGSGGNGSGSGNGGGAVGWPRAGLFTGNLVTRGISSRQITLCAHAALTFAPAFHTGPQDFNVFWDALNAKGGIFGRKVVETYEDDQYKPGPAVQAAKKCQAKNPFMILGGIGFDQIPAVRNWAEANHELYLYHSATVNGSAGDRYSFTAQPSVEAVGKEFAVLAAQRFKGKRIGIIYRDSADWDPGRQAFLEYAKQAGLDITVQRPVQANQGNYLQDVLALKGRADVVWAWANALETTEIIKQAQVQRFYPQWLVFPFNLTSQTLGTGALRPPLLGVAMFPPYSYHDYSGGFASYAPQIREFEHEYAKYDPGASKLKGVGGDLLFLNWIGQTALAQMFDSCGKHCTRDTFAGMMLSGYHLRIPGGCSIDFRPGDHHHGGNNLFISQAYRSRSGKVNFHPVKLCVQP